MQNKQPTEPQMEAIKRFAETHGRTWKSRLIDAWISGRDARLPDGGLLRQVRNQLGPQWLRGFKLTDEGHANANRTAHQA